MKKIIVGLILIGLIISGWFIFKGNDEDSSLKKVKVGEVTHSVFYAPQYVAYSLGYFEDEGLDVDIVLTSGVVNKMRYFLFFLVFLQEFVFFFCVYSI